MSICGNYSYQFWCERMKLMSNSDSYWSLLSSSICILSPLGYNMCVLYLRWRRNEHLKTKFVSNRNWSCHLIRHYQYSIRVKYNAFHYSHSIFTSIRVLKIKGFLQREILTVVPVTSSRHCVHKSISSIHPFTHCISPCEWIIGEGWDFWCGRHNLLWELSLKNRIDVETTCNFHLIHDNCSTLNLITIMDLDPKFY